MAGSGCRPPRCGTGEPQRAAHSSCCRITVNDDDRNPNTGGNCPAATSVRRKITNQGCQCL
uniref:Uncharacterized protein n=1 Tax=Romanomermis culicivorax TaxID=13658 RepID=A0A915JUY8_ROMCU